MAPSWTMAPSWLSTLWPHASDAGSSSSSSSSSSVAEYIGLPVKLPNAPWPAPPADPEKGLEPAATTTTTTSATPHGCSFPRIRTRRFFVFLVTYVLLVIAALYVLRDLGYIQRWRSGEFCFSLTLGMCCAAAARGNCATPSNTTQPPLVRCARTLPRRRRRLRPHCGVTAVLPDPRPQY